MARYYHADNDPIRLGLMGVQKSIDANNERDQQAADRQQRQQGYDLEKQKYENENKPMGYDALRLAIGSDPAAQKRIDDIQYKDSNGVSPKEWKATGMDTYAPQGPPPASFGLGDAMKNGVAQDGAGRALDTKPDGSIADVMAFSDSMKTAAPKENLTLPRQQAKDYLNAIAMGSREDIANAKIAEAARYHQMLGDAATQRALNGVASAGSKAETADVKRGDALRDSLDPNKARGGNLAKSQAMLNSAERIDALFKQFPDYNVPKGQTSELTAAVAGLVNGGSAQSQHQIDSITPQSLRGDAAGIASWLTNNPNGLEQRSFMKMMHDTSKREAAVAAGQVSKAQKARLSSFNDFKRKNPEQYKAIVNGYGLDENGDPIKADGAAPEGKEAAAPNLNASQQRIVNSTPRPPKLNDEDLLKQARSAPGDKDMIRAQLAAWGVKGDL